MTAVQLNYETVGPDDGEALLLGGSLGTTFSMWEPQLQELSQTVRTIAFDHRGHGGSPVPAGPYSIADLGQDVLALLDRMGIDQATYCGLSIGGMVGQWLAINAPERITKLIVICTAAHLPPSSAWIERAQSVRAAGSPEVVAEAVIGRWFTAPFAAANPEVVARHRAMIAATPAEGYAACCEAISTLDLRSGLPDVTAPTLVIGGAQDPSIPAEHGRAIAAAIPGARFELLDPAAHLASVERASEVTHLIEEHLEARK
jgi:3-oxoadipate enol-lactonase